MTSKPPYELPPMISKPPYELDIVAPVGLGGTGYACAQGQAVFAFAAEGHQGYRIFDVIDAPDGTRWRVIEAKWTLGMIYYRGVRA